MRSKAPLAVMEQLVMLLVFALSAALCLQVFVFSSQTSRRNEARDRAMLEAQNAAEALKSGSSNYFSEMSASVNGNVGYLIAYNANWQPVPADSSGIAYTLTTVETDSGLVYLWTAEVQVCTANGDQLAVLSVAGQNTGEVAYHG